MVDRRLRIMPSIEVPPDPATVLKPTKPGEGGGAYFRGEGEENLLCGECGHVLAENTGPGQIVDIFLQCPTCGAMNDVNP